MDHPCRHRPPGGHRRQGAPLIPDTARAFGERTVEELEAGAAVDRAHAIAVLTAAAIPDPAYWIDRPRPPRRSGTGPALRARIGERDGWICAICHRPVDPAHTWIRGPSAAERARAAQLLEERALEQLAAWVGENAARAAAVREALPELRPEPRGRNPALDRDLERLRRRVDPLYAPLLEGWNQRNHPHPSLEHLLPVCVGGGNDAANLRIAHHGCNVAGRAQDGDAAGNHAVIKAVNAARVSASVAAAARASVSGSAAPRMS